MDSFPFRYTVVAHLLAFIHISKLTRLISDCPVPQHVTFLAWLCGAENPKEYLLVLCCSPSHLITEVKNDVAFTYTVVSLGEGTSVDPLNIKDQIFVSLPNTFTVRDQGAAENIFLR